MSSGVEGDILVLIMFRNMFVWIGLGVSVLQIFMSVECFVNTQQG